MNILNQWVSQAAGRLGVGDSGRLSWQIASTIVVAALQRVSDPELGTLFLLKGGAFLERRLSLTARATKDVDAMFRGEVDDFVEKLDEAIREPWGPFTLRRTEIEMIEVPARRAKPRRFNVIVEIKGRTFRRIQVEVAFADGEMKPTEEHIRVADLGFFGLESPDEIATISLAYQVAQKLHACTDPHDPPHTKNDRVRDVVDLLLMRQQLFDEGIPLTDVRVAAVGVFDGRAAEAALAGHTERTWPPVVVSNEIWRADYQRVAAETGVELSLGEAISEVNVWIDQIAAA
ncbi:nucleotidyl transferase AbiEii/AbiGii toxin family protein [Leifsonia sp. NPDC056665]|uniref:nucleotidyl transferase AbiEii/AbiGii toxin family protein n=1 Tax=Leifsonia sp. NPDC056665 TaxID=3345901 RepID=UPI0036B54EBF